MSLYAGLKHGQDRGGPPPGFPELPLIPGGRYIDPAFIALEQARRPSSPFVQEGLIASATGRVQLGAYQEIRIRHFLHQTLDRYLAAASSTP